MKRFFIFFCVLSAACSDEFSPASRLDGLRVLAVNVDNSFAVPGTNPQLEIFVVSETPYQVAWFGGCDNPNGDYASKCLDDLNVWALTLSIDELNGRAPPTNAPAGAFGTGATFTATIPEDIISSRPADDSGTPPYGISYVYFAACAGELQPVNPPRLGFAIDCVDPSTGASLGPENFVVGYTPIYAYDAIANSNPQIAAIEVRDVVARCTKSDVDDCPDVKVFVDVDPSQIELDYSTVAVGDEPVAETLWASFFATVGEFETDTRLIADTGIEVRPRDESAGTWHVDPGYTGPATIYIVLRDNRGGCSWVTRDVTID